MKRHLCAESSEVLRLSYSLWVPSSGIPRAWRVQREVRACSSNIWSNNPLNDQNKSIVVHCNHRLSDCHPSTLLMLDLLFLILQENIEADNKRLLKGWENNYGWIHSIQNVLIFADYDQNKRRQGSHIVKVICSCGWKLIARHGNIWYLVMSSDVVLGGCWCWWQ